MNTDYKPRPELLDYKDGDVLICVVDEIGRSVDDGVPEFAAGDEVTVIGDIYLNDNPTECIRLEYVLPESKGQANYILDFVNGNMGKTMFVRKKLLTDEDIFEGKLAGGWNI